MNLLSGDEITLESTYLVFLNGMILGVIQRPEQFVKKYGRRHRRRHTRARPRPNGADPLPSAGRRAPNPAPAPPSFRRLRRAGQISEFVSVYQNHAQRCVYIASDGGRVCRPLIIVERGRPRVLQAHISVRSGRQGKLCGCAAPALTGSGRPGRMHNPVTFPRSSTMACAPSTIFSRTGWSSTWM